MEVGTGAVLECGFALCRDTMTSGEQICMQRAKPHLKFQAFVVCRYLTITC